MMSEPWKPSLELLGRYYREVFQPDQLVSLIGLVDFRQREFGFVLPDNKFIRNISFKSPSAIKEFLSTRVPLQAHVGGVYNIPPSKDNPISQTGWKYRELVFDIDLNEYDAVRVCGCRGSETYCDECWSLINDAMLFLDDTFRMDFGFEQLIWLFSGRRGVHLWICDGEAKFLDQEVRDAIINYLSMIRGEEYPFNIEQLPYYGKLLGARIIEFIATPYIRHASFDELQAQGFRKTEAQALKELVANKRIRRESFAQTLPTDVEPGKLLQQAIRMRYPRIDRSVTLDTRHLLRMAGSIHGNTGKMCTIIKDIANFTPDMAPTLWKLLQ